MDHVLQTQVAVSQTQLPGKKERQIMRLLRGGDARGGVNGGGLGSPREAQGNPRIKGPKLDSP